LLAAVQAAHGNVPIVITAHGLLQRNSDNVFPFAQDSNFWYLTGIDLPDILLVMDGSSEYLIVPGRTASREAFDGAVDVAALSAKSGIIEVYDEAEGWQKMKRSCLKGRQMATPAATASYIDQYGMYTNPARARLEQRIQEISDRCALLDIRSQLTRLRMIKQPVELVALQQAIDITVDSLALLTQPERFAGYHNEYEIEADLSREFRFRGATGHAFAPIIAGGQRAVTLHNVSNQAPLEPNSVVVLDVGAEVSHYAADITRTRVYGTATARQQQVFDAVLDVQAYALKRLKPGTLLKQYEQAIESYMGQTLHKLHLMKSSGSDVDHDVIRKYFPHATSHFLGLDVHDVGDYAQPLAAGMVLTCEPGMYIREEGIGVRLEDDVLITEDGNHVLSARLPKRLV
jgi:Xaa-Pro aminopeptidase